MAEMTAKTDEKKAAAKPEDQAKPQDLLEEDDEFEEFAEADWEANDEDAEDEKLWEDDWDDDDADDEFVVQLREELNKTAGGSS